MMLHEYETTVIVHPETTDEDMNRLGERLLGIVGTYQGTMLFKEDWGLRKLAYPIRKQPRGRYLYMDYASPADCVGEMERVLRIESGVLRFLTVRLGENVDVEAIKLAGRDRSRKPADEGETSLVDDREGDREEYMDDAPTGRPVHGQAAGLDDEPEEED
ncbi:MAG: 30S ribosomal protein S6 [Deltaproteobacteria bacterium]|nr:30S ribosomal protein S6 [Deltaproteobacteria bacterium]